MSGSMADLPALLRGLDPVLHQGVYVYACVQPGFDLAAMHDAEAG